MTKNYLKLPLFGINTKDLFNYCGQVGKDCLFKTPSLNCLTNELPYEDDEETYKEAQDNLFKRIE